jgi:hypothetical protein
MMRLFASVRNGSKTDSSSRAQNVFKRTLPFIQSTTGPVLEIETGTGEHRLKPGLARDRFLAVPSEDRAIGFATAPG